ncbi:TRAFAC clade GTPase domain-containing protein [Corynebacterium halotolerans]|uniref:TRAFAC clade GTPase domain-containing protein n=1 Tax=Corynebacterium halotolerans TaxID=225326 RepID=UPI003CEF296D
MKPVKTLDQHIAVFGESGSGKTVLISSFYGAAQEPRALRNNLFHVVADDVGEGTRLHQNYLGMRDESRVPAANKFSATSHSFSIKLKDAGNSRDLKGSPFQALRLVWHDYPGEWFHQEVSGPTEAERRVDTFRSLLGSDVALLLVDGQKLVDHAGEEERYLKSLLGNFRNSLLSLKDDLLEDGKPLVEFPRIWVIALSKADLIPEMDVINFRDLLIRKVAGEIGSLREVLGEFVVGDEALSVGEDFMLLSSAKFEPGKIAVDERIGVNLILPLAAMLPFERHVKWARAKQLPGKVAEALLGAGAFSAGAVAAVLLGAKFLPGPLGRVAGIVGTLLPKDRLDQAFQLGGKKLRALNDQALSEQKYLTATLTGFKMDLEKAEKDQILLRSVQ